MSWMWLWWLAGAIVIVAIVWALLRQQDRGDSRQESPEEILKRRYARGEIDRDEYERALRDLRR
ncbi:MAG: SHOCT domain-containing protein [Anaerolineales bacterium]